MHLNNYFNLTRYRLRNLFFNCYRKKISVELINTVTKVGALEKPNHNSICIVTVNIKSKKILT